MYYITEREPPTFLTFNYKKKLVSVLPAADYEGAVDMAQKEYPELAKVPRDQIIFTVPIFDSTTDRTIQLRISPDAWLATINAARTGQAVTIQVLSTRKGFLGFQRTQSEERAGGSGRSRSSEPDDVDTKSTDASSTITSISSWKSWRGKEKSPRQSVDTTSQ
ncbi:hypothetical protein AX15_006833 [Amanita polypyramis BW_CC]|nr:hypothetical protein AX15_006833 [Amanita polypyramis BW_CC]